MMELLHLEGYTRWQGMWALAFAIYFTVKLLSWQARRVRGGAWWRHVGFLVAWPGMDADAFLGRSVSSPPTRREWTLAVNKLLLGILLVGAAIAGCGRVEVPRMLVGWVGMVGLVFVLHFGLFHVLSCMWRRAGVEAVPIMDWPIVSTSVAEFWGRRWNLAFRDLSHRFVFRPLHRRIGAPLALLTGFVVSGVIHDLVISVPAGAGYGGPTAYFIAQGAAVFVERSALGKALGLGRGVLGWCFTVGVLLLPVTWLLHEPFVLEVVVPFYQSMEMLR